MLAKKVKILCRIGLVIVLAVIVAGLCLDPTFSSPATIQATLAITAFALFFVAAKIFVEHERELGMPEVVAPRGSWGSRHGWDLALILVWVLVALQVLLYL